MVRYAIAFLLALVLFVSGMVALRTGIYGWTIFVVHPFLFGALARWTFPAKSGGGAIGRGACSVLVISGILFLAGVEGGGCLLVCLPLTIPFGAIGAYVVHAILSRTRSARRSVAMLLLIPPATLAYDTHAQPVTYAVTTSLEIAAPPQKVWEQIVHLESFPEPSEWYFHTGLAYPTRVRLDGEGPGAMRYCEFTTGAVVEAIEVWDAPHLLRFRVLQNPPPMREWTPYKEVDPKHLHGYLISREGEFRLTPLPGNRTRLEGTSWYQHCLWPAQYWRIWSDAVFHRIHLRVFHQIQALAERS
jgi:hypothetical protein